MLVQNSLVPAKYCISLCLNELSVSFCTSMYLFVWCQFKLKIQVLIPYEFVLTSKYPICVSTKDDCLTARFLAVDYQHPSSQLPHRHWLAVPVPRNSPVSCLCLVCRYLRQGDETDTRL